jgi:D-alanyl-D-alanine carboxypeptidase/D-alanyl-D-alanine endopeptidase (penicillin-binding protein 7)
MSVKILKQLFVCAAMSHAVSGYALRLNSQNVIVVNDDTGKILLEKNADAPVPIASLTKLMTAMVVLDSKPDMNEPITIDATDIDMLKHSKSHVPIGTTLPRRKAFQLALMSSDNRAAASLARTYAGGSVAFNKAVNDKLKTLGMTNTVIKEPTGLSPDNKSSASDLVKMAMAASRYPEIVNITTDSSDLINMNGRRVTFHNTNQLVGRKGWDIHLSKTGFTNEAGHCLIMRFQQAGKNATLVLLNANASSSSVFDASNIRRFLTNPFTRKSSMQVARHTFRHTIQ